MGSPDLTRAGAAFGSTAAELGETRDPRRLIPGDPQGLRATAAALTEHPDLWENAGHAVRTLNDGGWSGHAADAAHIYTAGHTRRFLTASDGTRGAVTALLAHADALEWAQDQAREAVRQWDEADDYAAQRQRGEDDSGEDDRITSLREQAQYTLDRGRQHLSDQGRTTTTAAARAEQHIPAPRRSLEDPSPVTTPAAADTTPATLPASYTTPAPDIAPAATAPAAGPPPSTPEAYIPPPGTITAALNPGRTLAAVPTLLSSAPRTTPPAAAACEPATSDGDQAGPPWPAGRRVRVRPGETLTGIAQRELGDWRRWRELYSLNHGLVQSDGQTLQWPWMIQPGWDLVLPADATTPDSPAHPPTDPPAPGGPPPAVNIPAAPPPAVNIPPAPGVSAVRHPDEQGDGVDLGTGIYLGIGVAAAASAALLLTRRRRTFTYRPGSRRQTHDPTPPVIRQLHTAYQQRTPPTVPASAPPPSPAAQPAAAGPPPQPSRPQDRQSRPHLNLPMGTRGQDRVSLDITSTPGLVLDGAGAPGVARAILTTMLAGEHASRPLGPVLITAADAAELLGADYRHRPLPTELTILEELYAALTMMKFLLAQRRHRGQQAHNDPPVLLIATAPATNTHAGQLATQVLAAGQAHRICAILLGTWPGPTRCRVSADAIVTATHGPLAEPLHGARLYTIPAATTLDLLEAFAPPAPDQPTDPTPAPPPAKRTTEPHPKAPPPSHREIRRSAEPAAELQHEGPHTADNPPSERSAVKDLTLQVFGPPRLIWSKPDQAPHDITSHLGDKQRELLVYLALHPTGVRRDALAQALWPNSPTNRPSNGLHSTTGRLRQALTTATNGAATKLILASRAGIYQLNPNLIQVDYWQFQDALKAHRDAHNDDQRANAHRQTLTTYTAELAEGIDAEWLDTPRYNAFRHTIDAADTLARHLADNDPEQALAILEHARTIAPDNDTIYRDIIRIQHKLGRPDAADRTLALLTTERTEIGGSSSL